MSVASRIRDTATCYLGLDEKIISIDPERSHNDEKYEHQPFGLARILAALPHLSVFPPGPSAACSFVDRIAVR